MVPRYEQKDMTALWTDEAKFHGFLQVELSLLESLEKNGIAPKGTAAGIRAL